MVRSLAISALSFPFTLLAFVIGWAARDIRFGLLAGAAVFTLFFIAAAVSLFFIKEFSYLDAALPAVFAALWSLALAPFSFGASLFSAPAFIGAGLLLGLCLLLDKRYKMDKAWLVYPALVFVYEMLPINLPGPVDDAFALTSAAGVILAQFLRRHLRKAVLDSLRELFK
jgi:hypothetical protein